MNKIISVDQAAQISKLLHEKNNKIILTGGCFDILHAGHIKFLSEVKKRADILILLIESDESIRKQKGNNRPVNTQENRLKVLSSLSSVDYIIPLTGMTKGNEYDKLIVQIEPAFIAITVGDKNIKQRDNQCKMVHAKLVKIDKLDGLSSSNYINKI